MASMVLAACAIVFSLSSRVSAISHSSIFLRKKKYDDDGGYWRFLVQQKKGRDGLLGGV